MPDPSHRPYQPMTIIRPHTMPRFWWLCPWAYARTLHKALWALYDLGENADRVILTQTAVIEQQSEEIKRLRAQLVSSSKYHEIKNATINGITEDRENLLECGDDLADAVRKNKNVDWALEEWDKISEGSR